MKHRLILLIALLLAPPVLKAAEFYTPEQDKGGMTDPVAIDTSLPNVLIIGDSISDRSAHRL